VTPEKMADLTGMARGVMEPVLKVAARRLVQSMEEVHESEIRPLREVLKAVDHTLSIHGHIDANTALHKRVQAILNG